MHTYIMHTYKDLTDYVLLQVATPRYYICAWYKIAI